MLSCEIVGSAGCWALRSSCYLTTHRRDTRPCTFIPIRFRRAAYPAGSRAVISKNYRINRTSRISTRYAFKRKPRRRGRRVRSQNRTAAPDTPDQTRRDPDRETRGAQAACTTRAGREAVRPFSNRPRHLSLRRAVRYRCHAVTAVPCSTSRSEHANKADPTRRRTAAARGAGAPDSLRDSNGFRVPGMQPNHATGIPQRYPSE